LFKSNRIIMSQHNARDPPPPNVEYMDKTEDDDAGAMFKIENFEVQIDDNPNGVYIQGPRYINGRPYFVRLSFKPQDPMFIWYYNPNPGKMGIWMINNRDQFIKDFASKSPNPNAKAANKSKAFHPKDVTGSWVAFDMSKGSFVKSEMVFSALSAEEEKRAKIMKMKISGRTGYNRAMNGTYIRGKSVHAGRSYWRHTENDFTIRWFKTKWVIDWRGLHDDNIGAAVCKEDCPEPWMCNIPFRVYDGKAKDKKWKYDSLLKIEPILPKKKK